MKNILRYSWTLPHTFPLHGKSKNDPVTGPAVAQKVGRGIALLLHDCGTRRGWVVSSTPRPHFTPWKDPVPIVQGAGWAPGRVWTGGKSRYTGIRSPDCLARSQSLYRLSYPAHSFAWCWIEIRDSFAVTFILVHTLAPSSPADYKTVLIFRRSTFTRTTLLQKAMLHSIYINNIVTEACVDRLLTHRRTQVLFIYPKKEI